MRRNDWTVVCVMTANTHNKNGVTLQRHSAQNHMILLIRCFPVKSASDAGMAAGHITRTGVQRKHRLQRRLSFNESPAARRSVAAAYRRLRGLLLPALLALLLENETAQGGFVLGEHINKFTAVAVENLVLVQRGVF